MRVPSFRQMVIAALAVPLLLASLAPAQAPYHLTDGNPVLWGTNGPEGLLTPPALPADTYVRSLSLTSSHAMALLTNGSVVVWGTVNAALLNIPALPAGTTYTAISASPTSCYAVRSDGALIAWGQSNGAGQLTVPALPAGVTYTSVAAGTSFALALRSNGTVVGFGTNITSQLNVPALPAGVTYTSVAATTQGGVATRSNFTTVQWGGVPQAIPNLPAGVYYNYLATGTDHVVSVLSDGAIVNWGTNGSGQLNVPGAPAGTVYVHSAGGVNFSLGLRSNGTIAAWGANNFGQLNVPALPANRRYVAVYAGIDSGTSGAVLGATHFPGDLRLFGFGPSVQTATINRPITVEGDLLVETFSALQNAPTVEVGGDLRLSPGAVLSGQAQINVTGDLVTPPAGSYVLLQNTTAVVEGRVTGTVGLQLDGSSVTFNTHNTIAFASYIYAYGASVIDFTGTARFGSKGLLINSPANLRLSAGQTYVNSSNGYNAGQLDVLGSAAFPATFESKGAFQNFDPGTLNATNATLRFPAGLNNYADIRFTSGHSDVFGNINNINDASTGTGSILVTGGASATFYNNLVNNGSITVSKQGSTTSVLTILGTLSGAGSILGQGDTFIEGTFSPGNSPAAVSVEGDLHLTPSSTLLLELAGTTLGTGYDHLDVGGTLALAGKLSVVVLPGYNVFSSFEYDLLDFAGRSGQFSQISLPPLTGKWVWDTSSLYTDGKIRITTNIIPEPSAALLLLPALTAVSRRRR